MRSSFVSPGGFALKKSPNYRRQSMRRRLALICALLGLAGGAALIGALTAPKGGVDITQAASTGPFSYFPHQ